ncbi:MAG TPA: hypothetical protein VNI57_08265 [Candidatus Saccharimonadales bacterium]|nr:hypothetical protein [Candidatus Saccharimonadales bacterium]
MSSRSRRIRKWTVRLLLTVTSLAALDIAILLYPTPLFAYSQSFGSYRVYADEPIPDGTAGVIEDLTRRVAAMEHGSPGGSHRIYLCNSTRRYALLAFLARRSSESQAIGLSFPDESFVQMPRLRRFAALNRETLPHSRFEGNLAEAVAHEIAHFNSLHALGLRRHLALPVWKSEGWAEYQANLAAIHADPGYDLHARIDRLLDDGFWARGHGASRRMWEAQLLVEFLGEVKGYRLADLAREDVTEISARDAMIEWWRSR